MGYKPTDAKTSGLGQFNPKSAPLPGRGRNAHRSRHSLDRPLRGEWVQIVIEGVYSGAREPDLAISELRVISQPAR